MTASNHRKVSGLIEEILALLPVEKMGDAVVFGSSAIVLNGVDLKREVDDLDIFVSTEDFYRLESLAMEKVCKAGGVEALKLADKIEILKEFPGVSHGEVLRNASIREGSHGLLVASLEDLLRWKRAQNREKDRRDIALIEAHLTKTHKYPS